MLDRRFHRKRIAHLDATAAPYAAEELRALVQSWHIGELTPDPNSVRVDVRSDVQNPERRDCIAASVGASRDGLIAVIGSGAEAKLVCASYRAGRWNLNDTPYRLLAMARSITGDTVESNPKFESSARAAVRRWLAHGSAHRLAGSLTTPSRARRLLLAHIDAQSLRAAAHTRATLARRIENVRTLINQAISAGAEHTLGSLARRSDTDLNALLSACEEQLPIASAEPTRANGPWTLRALLLLRVP